jgi:murein DD-endopeptidase MepM/ murein hydrolase activator NlpD
VRALRTLALLLALAIAGSAGTYTVRWGDTLGGVAHRFGVPLRSLLAANHLTDPNRVRQGQVLTIPSRGAPEVVLPTRLVAYRTTAHRVAPGETLGAIAHRYGTSVRQIVARNGIRDPDRVREGTILQVDGAAAPAWVCPVQGPVRFVSGFGDPRGAGRTHEGVDLAAARGTPVVANVGGEVARHPNPRGGLAYYLHGDDGDTYYGAHLESYVGPDRRVRLGEAIGRVGDSGDARGGINHLHFERLPDGGAAVDPMPLLVRACPTR